MNTLTPKEVKVIHMALETFIEDNTAMRTDQTIPFNGEARRLMKDMFETATSALKKIQLASGYAVQLDPYNEGDEETKTLGEARVRTDFNVTNNSTVDLIKQKTAELINICETLKENDGRLASLAQTSFEEAAMWAVKAATA